MHDRKARTGAAVEPDSLPSGEETGRKPLTVVMVDSHATIERGGAVQCASLARGLARRGHRVTCVFDGRPGMELEGSGFRSLVAAGVEVLRLPLRSPLAARRFRRLLAERRPDLLHTHKNRALFFAFLATLGAPRPPWFANRGTVYPLSRDPLAHRIHRRHVRCIMAVSEAVREALVADGIEPSRARTVYGSFETARFDPGTDGRPMREKWGLPEGTRAVGMVASLTTPKKGHPVFLEAAALLARHDPELRFVLVGEGDPAPLRELAGRLGIEGQVVFAGFEEEMPAAYAALDVVVCASLRGEGLTGAVREALAMARPVVSTDVAGNRELVIPGRSGLLVPPGNPQALAQAVAELLEDREEAARLGEEGRGLVLENCTEEMRAKKVEGIYRELLESP